MELVFIFPIIPTISPASRDWGHMGYLERWGPISRDYGKGCYARAKNNNIGCEKDWPWLKKYQLKEYKGAKKMKEPYDPGCIPTFFGTR